MHATHRFLSLRAMLVSAVLLAILGCTSDTSKLKIHGKVTLDDVPVQKGAITFRPTDGKTATAGAVITDGQYTAEVPPGNMRVEITAPKVVGKKKLYDTPDSPTADVVQDMIPPQYNVDSRLTVDVRADRPEVDFRLSSKK